MAFKILEEEVKLENIIFKVFIQHIMTMNFFWKIQIYSRFDDPEVQKDMKMVSYKICKEYI